MPNKARVYVALFEGQGGWVTSQGVFALRDDIRALGARADVYRYEDEAFAHPNVDHYRVDGYKVALWGYSLGTSTALYEQAHEPVDLLMCCAISRLETTWKVAACTWRSILWHGPGILSSGGEALGFHVVKQIWVPPIPILGHLLMQVSPVVVSDTLAEIRQLQG